MKNSKNSNKNDHPYGWPFFAPAREKQRGGGVDSASNCASAAHGCAVTAGEADGDGDEAAAEEVSAGSSGAAFARSKSK